MSPFCQNSTTEKPGLLDMPRGFTLVEALFGMTLFVLIGGAVWYLQNDFTKANALLQSSLTGQHEINRTFKIFSAEIRTTSLSSLGAYPVAEASAASITFYADADRDGLKERLRYFLQNSELKRGYLKPTGEPLVYNPANERVTTVVRDVANGATDLFSYFDSSYDGTSAPLVQPVDALSVRLVKVTIIIDKNGTRAPTAESFTTQVSLRNLKDNT